MTTRSNKPRPHGEFFEPAPTVGGPLLQAREARRQLAHREAWLHELYRRLCRALVAQHGPMAAEEIAAAEVARAVADFDSIASRFTVASYARQRANLSRAYIDYLRRDNAQRGAGARGRRKVLHAAAAARVERRDDDEKVRPIEEIIADPIDQFEAALVSERIARALEVLSAEQRRIIELVDLEGLEVTEAAQRLGIRRETASRRLSKARAALRLLLEDLRRDDD
ncbi:MAG: RNA polymerase sigma factor [Ilumatobacteraceae bacterium]